MNPAEEYGRRCEEYRQKEAVLEKKANSLSNCRFFVFFGGLAAVVILYVYKQAFLAAGTGLAALILFIYMVSVHRRMIKEKQYASLLYKINTQGSMRTADAWKSFDDKGEEFFTGDHPYAEDLDLFGKGSLFQYINTAHTYLGRKALRDLLVQPPDEVEDIYRRQEAVRELGAKLDWRQRLEAESMTAGTCAHDPQPLLEWGRQVEHRYLSFAYTCLRFGLPALSLILSLLSWLTPVVPEIYGIAGWGIQFVIVLLGSRKWTAAFAVAEGFHGDIRAYYRMLQVFEDETFTTPIIEQHRVSLRDAYNHSAYRQVQKLSALCETIYGRRNVYYFIWDIITLSDLHILASLNRWKQQSGKQLEHWMQVLGELEAWSSLSLLRFDHPDWTMPVFEGKRELHALQMGHPLLGKAGVRNSVVLDEAHPAMLITGSNMSGKSTLLRTAGINLVLAYAGAPVCAEQFYCGRMEIYTCMRISDNLEKNISSFYAEILRIKSIVQAAEQGREVFYLLDEIFKGTNSMDRHLGAKMLVQKLLQRKTLGMISTHDLELGELEQESGGKVVNHHFREYYEDGEIRFDYHMRSGVSTTRNARYLMKLAGIEM